MSLQNSGLTEDQRKKAEAIKLGVLKLTPRQRVAMLEKLKSIAEARSGAKWEQFSRPDPITFGTEVLNLRPNEVQMELGLPWYTEDQKILFTEVTKNRRVLALSGNGVGKTYSAAIISLWLYHRGYTVLTTAPTLAQVTDMLWAEMRTLQRNAKPGVGGTWQPKANKAVFTEKHFLQGFTVQTDISSNTSTTFQGRHKNKMAIVMDEVIGMSAGVIEACDTICVGPEDVVIGIGNPTDTTAPIRRASEVVREDGTPLWKTIHISGENHPNVKYHRTVIPGAVSYEMVQDQLAKSGSREGSRYKSSVLGQWPDETPDTLISIEWIKAAQERGRKQREDEYKGIAIGVDVAGEGGDITPAIGVSKNKVFMPKLSYGKAWIQGRDTSHCVKLVKRVLDEVPDIRVVAMDATAIGQGPVAQLQQERYSFPRFLTYKRSGIEQYNKEQQAVVVGINFSSSPDDLASEKFVRMKDQMWWDLREAFRLGEIDLPTDEELRAWDLPSKVSLIDQLRVPIHIQDNQGRIIVLDKRGAGGGMHKERTKSLPDRSPDFAHSLMMAWFRYKRLPKGERPIKDLLELQQVEMQIAKQKMKKRLAISGPRHLKTKSHRQLPWQRL